VRVTAYTYPWDVARIGVDRVLEDLAGHGIDAIDLAASYHPIDTLSPRGDSVRTFTSPRGAVHFPARIDRYHRIRPSVSSREISAAWPAIVERAPSFGLAVNAWVVVLYQPWIVDAYPDCTRVLPGGDPVGSGVCASNDDVREYVATLCEDLVDQFGVDLIRLEGVAPGGYDYGWLRPRVLVDVPPLAQDLLALCFCQSCVTKAASSGLDVERLRRIVTKSIIGEINPGESGEVDEATLGDGEISADPELHEFVVQHERASIDLIGAVRSRVGGSIVSRLSTTTWTTYSSLLGADANSLFGELADVIDQLLVGQRDAARLENLVEVEHPRAGAIGRTTLVTPMRNSVPGGMAPLLGVPDEGGLGGRVRAYLELVAPLGLEEVCLYNYGLLRDRDIRDIIGAVTAVWG
jgi:hypothetical protein